MATTKEFSKKLRVHEITVTLTYADTTSAKMFSLPNGARGIGAFYNVKTAFSGGVAELDIGSADDPDYYADGIVLSAAGCVYPTTQIVQPGYKTTQVEEIYMNVGAGNTVGEVDVTCLFSFPMDSR